MYELHLLKFQVQSSASPSAREAVALLGCLPEPSRPARIPESGSRPFPTVSSLLLPLPEDDGEVTVFHAVTLFFPISVAYVLI